LWWENVGGVSVSVVEVSSSSVVSGLGVSFRCVAVELWFLVVGGGEILARLDASVKKPSSVRLDILTSLSNWRATGNEANKASKDLHACVCESMGRGSSWRVFVFVRRHDFTDVKHLELTLWHYPASIQDLDLSWSSRHSTGDTSAHIFACVHRTMDRLADLGCASNAVGIVVLTRSALRSSTLDVVQSD
jgi:hypothetical protein